MNEPELTFTPRARIRAIMNELDVAHRELASALQNEPLRFARVHPLPDVAEGCEEQPIVRIDVATLEGDAAREAAIAAFSEYTLRPGCSSKATFRLPGWLHFPAASHTRLAPLVSRVNELKIQFKQEVQQAGGRDEKFDLVHDALPGTITLQVYRQLALHVGELLAIGFTWADKQAIRKISKEEAMAMLERSKGYVPALMHREEWQARVEQEMIDVRRLGPDTELRIRRAVKTHPMANLRWGDRLPDKQQVKASLPLIVCSDGAPRAKALGHYPTKMRQIRSDRRGSDRLLIERMHIFVRDV